MRIEPRLPRGTLEPERLDRLLQPRDSPSATSHVDVSLIVRRLAIALLLFLLTSCVDDAEQLGVSMLHDRPVAISAPCRGEDDLPVIELLLTEEDNNPGGGDDQVLWRAVPREPSVAAFVTPFGAAPDGYETTIPLARRLDPSTRYSLLMQPGGVVVFRTQDLEPGRIWSEIGRLSPERFVEYAREGCGSGDLVDGAETVVLQLQQ